MTMNLFQTAQYRTLMKEHIHKTIIYLFEQDQDFAIACETKHVTFDPELPAEIKETFNETVLFVISGYTFESAKINDEYFIFEAGFGSENFGSAVHVPLLAIKQIFVGEHPIVINLAESAIVPKQADKAKNSKAKNSMEALLNNPENKKLLKKKQ
ncbi:hypothetical protein YH65_09245 [Sulfurovum lithotrophicum]|uniref:Stringent starvation protein B n=2 Tax=Sulfurovum lithotrophicum TaxID=206403 RepID=A0A7U4M2A7_9BACT|nr:hypothetical protein YH65_09245 [Sulfurovum lithotrophicum]